MKFKENLVKGYDYYIDDDGMFVFTKKYHLERGYCCKTNPKRRCKHCPYKDDNSAKK